MKKRNTLHHLGLPILLMVIVAFASCQDNWDEHYNRDVVGKSDIGLFDYIASQEDLSYFAEMLFITGYDSVLNAGQVYTVWAPTNDALSTVFFFNIDDMKLFVENHICWFSKPVRDADDQIITTLNNKRLLFTKGADGFLYDNRHIAKSDIALRNGIVHVLDGYVPYRLNLWEYLLQAEGFESLQAYVNSLFEYELDGEASFDGNGILIDSVMKVTNPILTLLGGLNLEDSTYTMIMPNENAWNEGLELTKSYFKTLEEDGGEEVQEANAKWTMVKDLIYRERLKVPYADTVVYSTYGTNMGSPDSLFFDKTYEELSNGYAYTATHYPFKAIPTWHKEIRIEAEDNQGNTRIPNNYTLVNTSSVGTNVEASGKSFVTAIPKTMNRISQLFIRFPIPNTLSAKYNIYAVFIPSSVIDKNDKRPYKVSFALTYVGPTGRLVKDAKMSDKIVTDSTNVTKVLVAENFSFPYSNIVSMPGLTGTETATVNIRIKNETGVTAEEMANFNRTIRVDCIILEPVQ